MKDYLGREIDYMRISITDRCNLQCCYCMPYGTECSPGAEILTLEELAQIAACGAALGIRKIKVTGGEPLVRLGCCEFIRMLKKIPKIEKVTITTNGILLSRYLKELLQAGIDGINISLDTLNPELYHALTGCGRLQPVLNTLTETINACAGRNISIKINAVSLELESAAEKLGCEYKGTGWSELLKLARDYPVDLRFIEMMPIGYGKQYPFIDHRRLLNELKSMYPGLQEDHNVHGYGPAVYYRIPGFKGSIGLISAIHGKFCDRCNRIRLTSQGYLKSCLCYQDGADLKKILRNYKITQERKKMLLDTMAQVIWQKPGAHCFEHPEQMTEYENMVHIGG